MKVLNLKNSTQASFYRFENFKNCVCVVVVVVVVGGGGGGGGGGVCVCVEGVRVHSHMVECCQKQL